MTEARAKSFLSLISYGHVAYHQMMGQNITITINLNPSYLCHRTGHTHQINICTHHGTVRAEQRGRLKH